MPPSPPPQALLRPAAAVNAEIRALWPHPAMRLTDEERQRYEVLVVEWAVAVAAERVEVEVAA